jgi:hypothetical protein
MSAPHCGQLQAGSCTTRSRGRCSGSARDRAVRSVATVRLGLAATVQGELQLLDLALEPLRGAAELHAPELGDE